MSLRYHVVSLAIALMALAAGLVLGYGPLQHTVSTVVDSGTAQQQHLQDQVAAARTQQTYAQSYAQATSVALVHGKLTGARVTLVVAPLTSPAEVKAVTDLLVKAGAVVGGTVTLKPAWTLPAQSAVLSGIVTSLAPTGTPTAGAGVYDEAGAALATALVTKVPTAVGHSTDSGLALLSGLSGAGFVTLQGKPDLRADSAVMLGPIAPGAVAASTLLPLASSLASGGRGAVLAAGFGSGGPGGLLTALRADSQASSVVSGVDVADLASGQVTVVLALAGARTGTVGQYGAGSTADAAAPQ